MTEETKSNCPNWFKDVIGADALASADFAEIDGSALVNVSQITPVELSDRLHDRLKAIRAKLGAAPLADLLAERVVIAALLDALIEWRARELAAMQALVGDVRAVPFAGGQADD